MERQIRQDKKNLAGLQGIIKSNTTDNKLIEDTKMQFSKQSLIYKTHQNELDNFIQQTLLTRDNTRLYTGKQNKSVSTQVANVTKIANRYNKEIIGIKVNGVEIKEVGEHIISRTYARNVAFEDVQDTLKNPVKYGKIRSDKSQQVKGENCTIVINTETGKLITVYPQKTRRESKK